MIRLATRADAPGMLKIYAPFVRDSGITQEIEIPSVQEFGSRIEKGRQQFPWLVYARDEDILGYAYASRYRERAGYRWHVESTVYLSPSAYGKKLGAALYTCLFRLLTMQGYINAYAVITLPNEKSIRFHEKFGFRYFATFRNVGFKLGKWHDVGWMEFIIQEHPRNPAEPISFDQVSEQDIALVLGNMNNGFGIDK